LVSDVRSLVGSFAGYSRSVTIPRPHTDYGDSRPAAEWLPRLSPRRSRLAAWGRLPSRQSSSSMAVPAIVVRCGVGDAAHIRPSPSPNDACSVDELHHWNHIFSERHVGSCIGYASPKASWRMVFALVMHLRITTASPHRADAFHSSPPVDKLERGYFRKYR
jgi:hypothetical protein